jgi:hypothetical protein
LLVRGLNLIINNSILTWIIDHFYDY